jgi:hypothetical protein
MEAKESTEHPEDTEKLQALITTKYTKRTKSDQAVSPRGWGTFSRHLSPNLTPKRISKTSTMTGSQ